MRRFILYLALSSPRCTKLHRRRITRALLGILPSRLRGAAVVDPARFARALSRRVPLVAHLSAPIPHPKEPKPCNL